MANMKHVRYRVYPRMTVYSVTKLEIKLEHVCISTVADSPTFVYLLLLTTQSALIFSLTNTGAVELPSATTKLASLLHL